MKVMKFGGGCLKDSECFARVSTIIRAEKERTVVVVSAIYGITDILIDGIHEAIKTEKNIPKVIAQVRDKHQQIVRQSIKKEIIRETTLKEIDTRLSRVEKLLYGSAYTEEITDSVRALILSYGERLAALVLASMLTSEEKTAVSLEADKIGMITDESLDNATVLFAEAKDPLSNNILAAIDRNLTPVVTGYFGCTAEGKISTFGRNGSDYSAAVIASSINAGKLEIWKDVDGFMSADPKIVKNARRVTNLSYYEAAELSYFGARILHPRTVEPLVKNNVSIQIKNLLNPMGAGTEISQVGIEEKDILKSVTYNQDIAVLRIHGPGVGYKPGIIAEIGAVLSHAGINIYSILTSQTCINLLIDKQDAPRSYKSLKKLTGGVIERVDLDKYVSLIAVVGEGLLKKEGVAAKVFSAVSQQKVNVEMISAGASEVAYYFIVNGNDLRKVINAIHHQFFKSGAANQINSVQP